MEKEKEEQKEQEKQGKRKEKEKRITTWSAIKDLNCKLADYKNKKKENLIRGKKQPPNIVKFKHNLKSCVEIAESEGFEQRPEDAVLWVLKEGESRSPNFILKKTKKLLSKSNNKCKLSKRELLKFLFSLEDVTVVNVATGEHFAIKPEAEEKIKSILIKTGIKKKKVQDYFDKKLRGKNKKIKESKSQIRKKHSKKSISVPNSRGSKLPHNLQKSNKVLRSAK